MDSGKQGMLDCFVCKVVQRALFRKTSNINIFNIPLSKEIMIATNAQLTPGDRSESALT